MFVTAQKIYPVFNYLKLFRTSPGCFCVYQKLHQRYAYIPVCRETRCMQSDFSRYRNRNFISLKNHKPYICSFMSVQRFHNSNQCHGLPLVECLLLIQVVKLTVVISGRKWNKWLNIQTDTLRSHYRQRLFLLYKIGISLAVLTCVTLYLSNLEDTPVTGRKRYITNNNEQMVGPLERFLDSHITSFIHSVSAGNSNYWKVNAIIRKIVESNKDFFPDLMPEHFTVRIIRDDPWVVGTAHSGEVLIAQEFLSACSSVDEIAAVLGHELAHYALSHLAERFSFLKLVNFIYIIGLMVPIWFFISKLTYAVLAQIVCSVLKFLCIYLPPMRRQEKEADIVGLQMMAKACYDARAATVIFTKLYEFLEEMEKLPKRTPDNELSFKVIDCFASHPAFPLRIEYMERLISENGNLLITKEFLNACSKIDEIAMAIGHELAHYGLSHPLFIYLPYMRQLEKEADIVGLQMMAKACYDARAATVIFTKLSEFDKEIEKFPKRTPDNELLFEIMECFATHPVLSLRIEYMERLIPEVLKLRKQCNCPPLKIDPRKKFYARKQKKDEIKKKIST